MFPCLDLGHMVKVNSTQVKIQQKKHFQSHVASTLKAELQGVIFAYDFHKQFLYRTLLVSRKNRIRFSRYHIARPYD